MLLLCLMLLLLQAFVRTTSSRFTRLWIFWLGPVLGGVSAALCQVGVELNRAD